MMPNPMYPTFIGAAIVLNAFPSLALFDGESDVNPRWKGTTQYQQEDENYIPNHWYNTNY